MFENLLARRKGGSVSTQGMRWEHDTTYVSSESVANDIAVALRYNEHLHALMMMTPDSAQDFCLGFSLTEHIVNSPDELRHVHLRELPQGMEANLATSEDRFRVLDRRQRFMTGRVGCGLCGAQTLAQAMRAPRRVGDGRRLTNDTLQWALRSLTQLQPVNRESGAMHAAAWLDNQGQVSHVREDSGRHNALDKLVGALAHENIAFESGAALITSRASYEIVQKAAAVGIQVLCAISASTALAIRMARGITLIAFARDKRHTTYTHTYRLIDHRGERLGGIEPRHTLLDKQTICEEEHCGSLRDYCGRGKQKAARH